MHAIRRVDVYLAVCMGYDHFHNVPEPYTTEKSREFHYVRKFWTFCVCFVRGEVNSLAVDRVADHSV